MSAEAAPEFADNTALQEGFFRIVGVQWLEPWTRRDTENAFHLWARHVAKKRSGAVSKRPIADVLIEAFAQRFQGLITRNTRHFSSVRLIIP